MKETKILSQVNIGTPKHPIEGLLFGNIKSYGNNDLQFRGATITEGGCGYSVRDFLNYSLDPKVMDNAFILNERTYNVIISWVQKAINEIRVWINDIPECSSKREGVIILNNEDIKITGFGKDIIDGVPPGYRGMNAPKFRIASVSYDPISPIPGFCAFSCIEQLPRQIDEYRRLISTGIVKYISNSLCEILCSAIQLKFSDLIVSIKHVYKYRVTY